MVGKSDKVNFVEVSAHCYACPIEEIVAQISANTNAQVKTLQSVVKQRIYTIRFVETIVWGIIAIILTASVLMMGLFMLSSVNERKKEIGIMRAVGYSKLSIFAAICTEAVILLLFSGTIGYIAGYLASMKVLSVLEIDAMHGALPVAGFLITVMAAVFMAVIASAIPAMKAARMNPAEALNRL
jgi:putative ABC transport system permease protein